MVAPSYISPGQHPVRARRLPRGVARGLSLVELMVGIAVGLFIVAAATVLVSGQLGENRKLMIDTQIQQDLRATADIITRELRRAGSWRGAHEGISSATTSAQENALAANLAPSAPGAAINDITFFYERDDGIQGPWGFRLNTTTNAIETRLGSGLADVAWQELTDRNVMRVTSFTIEVQNEPGQVLPCPQLCPGTNDTSCWPVLRVRNFVVNIAAQSRVDASITRNIRSTARARNDWVQFRTGGSPQPACPS